jgi:hypothetical protein
MRIDILVGAMQSNAKEAVALTKLIDVECDPDKLNNLLLKRASYREVVGYAIEQLIAQGYKITIE